MATETDKKVKILLAEGDSSTGCTFSMVDPDASLEGLFKLGKGICNLKKKSYEDIYYVTEVTLEQ